MNLLDFGIVVNPHGPEEQRVPCSRCDHGPRDEAMGVNIVTGVFHCFRCGWKGRTGSNVGAPAAPVQRINDPGVAARKRDRLRQTWKESVPLSSSKARPVRTYLESRALGAVLQRPPVVLRAHPGLRYWDGVDDFGKFPAMIALFNAANGTPVSLHATYLRDDGCAKASVPSPKKILGVPVQGATRGGAIHLYKPRDGTLGISEGIESALSLHLLQRMPVWASFCADNLARCYLPRDLRELHIGVDLDQSGKGQQVAQVLAARVRKLNSRTKVFFVTPELEGHGDLNDELRRRAG
jgi:hypothetical protein